MPDLEIDNITLILLLAVAGLLLYDRVSRPAPLVHPLLLGKQSEVSPVRKENESGVYRSFATGHGTPLIVRPASSLKTVRDVIPMSKGVLPSQRIVLDTPLTDDALSELVRLLPLGMRSLFPELSSNPALTSPVVVLLPPNPRTSLPLLLLSLSSTASHPLIILPESRFLIPALTSNDHLSPGLIVVHESLAEGVVEQVMECEHACGVLVVGDPANHTDLSTSARNHGMNVRFWDEVWEAGERASTMTPVTPAAQPDDIHSYYYASDGTGHTVTAFTHMNFTAGIAGFLSAFPADKRPSAAKKDVVASVEPLTSPFGMTVALASIWSGAGFSLIGSESIDWKHKAPRQAAEELRNLAASSASARPSILILSKEHHHAIVQAAHGRYRQSSLAAFAFNSRVAEIQSGYVSRKGFWDDWVWKGIREGVFGGLIGEKLRTLIVLGEPPSASTLAWSNILLGLPTARVLSTQRSAGPIVSTHFYDLQCSTAYLASEPCIDGPRSHIGAPTINIEVVLRGIGEVSHDAEKGETQSRSTTVAPPGYGADEAIRGKLYARGPAFGAPAERRADADTWHDVGVIAAVQTNGTFCIDSS